MRALNLPPRGRGADHTALGQQRQWRLLPWRLPGQGAAYRRFGPTTHARLGLAEREGPAQAQAPEASSSPSTPAAPPSAPPPASLASSAVAQPWRVSPLPKVAQLLSQLEQQGAQPGGTPRLLPKLQLLLAAFFWGSYAVSVRALYASPEPPGEGAFSVGAESSCPRSAGGCL